MRCLGLKYSSQMNQVSMTTCFGTPTTASWSDSTPSRYLNQTKNSSKTVIRFTYRSYQSSRAKKSQFKFPQGTLICKTNNQKLLKLLLTLKSILMNHPRDNFTFRKEIISGNTIEIIKNSKKEIKIMTLLMCPSHRFWGQVKSLCPLWSQAQGIDPPNRGQLLYRWWQWTRT